MSQTIIVGAGPVGCLLSLYLHKKKQNVKVIEKRSNPILDNQENGRSINLALSFRGIQALTELGLAEEVLAISLPMYGREVHLINQNPYFQSYSSKNEAIYSISRIGLNKLLASKVMSNNIPILYNTEVKNIDFEKKIINDDSNLKYENLIGADGAFSIVKKNLTNKKWIVSSIQETDYAYKEIRLNASKYGTHIFSKSALHIWPRNSFMLIALPNLDGSFTCTIFLPLEGDLSFNNIKSKNEVELFFKEYFPDLNEYSSEIMNEWFENPVSKLFTSYAKSWHIQNTLLIGDAAHSILPFYGQGMNCGLEDVFMFDKFLDEHSVVNSMELFYQKRYQDAQSIGILAYHNFIEMRDKVSNPYFVLKKKLDKFLSIMLVDSWKSSYSQVSFSDEKYFNALQNTLWQDFILDKILYNFKLKNENEFETHSSKIKTLLESII